jgi:hypothetical protein
MAYDLFLRTNIDKNYARGDEPIRKQSVAVGALSLGLAGFVMLLPAYLRRKENIEYRSKFSTDLPEPIGPRRSYMERRLRTTVEMPAIPMKDLVYGNRQTE